MTHYGSVTGFCGVGNMKLQLQLLLKCHNLCTMCVCYTLNYRSESARNIQLSIFSDLCHSIVA